MLEIPFYRIVFDLILMAIVWVPIPMFWNYVTPYQRGFFCDDSTIRYPFKSGTVSSLLLYSLGGSLPAVAIILVEGFRTFYVEPRWFRSNSKSKAQYSLGGRAVHPYASTLYVYLGYFLFGMALNFLLTDMTKYTVGRLRPHFISVCKPDWSLINCSCTGNDYGDICKYGVAYIEDAHCTETDKWKLKHARVSFPSGHASFSAYTMVYFVLYLHCRMIWPLGGLLAKHVLQFGAMILTILTCLSRITDHKHHWSDVLVGFILGTVMAFITAYCIAGFARRPQNTFARPGPYDSRQYSGAQLVGISREESKLSSASIIMERNDVV